MFITKLTDLLTDAIEGSFSTNIDNSAAPNLSSSDVIRYADPDIFTFPLKDLRIEFLFSA